ncbi:hypothetical protein LJB92_01765 [Bacteroidales bacterium OttesenSCG-928-M06]|nr:hypothetical protein [Bacteroidales bacterium OttesenSCG-928-M06]
MKELRENLMALGVETEIDISERRYPADGARFLRKKHIAGLLPNFIYFLAYDYYVPKAFLSTTFTGLYTEINLPEEAECRIYKKDWFDKFIYVQRQKTGIKYIDSNVTVTTSGWTPKNLSEESINLFMELNKGDIPYKIIIEHNYMPRIINLEGKKVLAIETERWIEEKKELEILIKTGSNLIQSIKNDLNRNV